MQQRKRIGRYGSLLEGYIVLATLSLVAVQVSAQQAQSANAVAPSIATQPLYACLVYVADLPEYDGTPTPEMQAASIGIRQSVEGMLDQWFINNDFPLDAQYGPVDSSTAGSAGPSKGSSSSSGAKRGNRQHATPGKPAAGPHSRSHQQRKPTQKKQQNGKAAARTPAPPNSSSSSSSGKPAAPPVNPANPGFMFEPGAHTKPAPAPAAPLPPKSYIIPRPAAMAAAVTASVDDAQSQLSVDPSLVAAAATAAYAAADIPQQDDIPHTDHDAVSGASYGQQQQQLIEIADASPQAPAAVNATGTNSTDATKQTQVLPPQLPPSRRHLLQTVDKRVCNKGTPTRTDLSSSYIKNGFSAIYGEVGIAISQTNVIPPDPTLAVGPYHAVHVVNSLVRIIPLTPSGTVMTNAPPGEARLIPLPDFFSTVASPCSGGYINPAAAYDKEIGRFLLTAICGGDSNQVMLAVSTTSSATGSWILYSFAGEVTQSSPMACDGYPVSFYSQVTYNKDGVYLTFIQNCPDNQETATGAVLFALPKWAVYKGATYFWVPVWTANDIYTVVGAGNNEEYYTGAFVQLQPVIPQRSDDVQAEVVYFVSDNLNYVNPLQRTTFTLAALINTGSLWLYEGPDSSAPAPLLVARILGRGITALAVPDTKLVQPIQETSDAAPVPSQQCQELDAGAMRPPGIWSGGAALYANTIYLADRGPDIQSEVGDLYGNGIYLPTVYWAALTPSFCVSGPCAPWFGSDWGWSDGWDWVTGTWAADSDRGKNAYTDPAFYNQVFLYPTGTTSSPTATWKGRRLQQLGIGLQGPSSSSSSSSSSGAQLARDALGVPVLSSTSGGSGGGYKGSLTAAAIRAQLGPTASREEFAAAVKAALDRMEQLKPTTVAIPPSQQPAAPPAAAPQAAGQLGSIGADVMLPAISAVRSGDGDILNISMPSSYSSNTNISSRGSISASNSSGGNSSSTHSFLQDPVRSVAAGRGAGGGGSSGSSSGSSCGSSGNANTFQAAPATGGGGGGGQASVSNLFYGNGYGNSAFLGWNGWGNNDNRYYYDYYAFWKEHYFLRNLYMNLRIPPKVNPCKFYKDWSVDNTITFGAIVSKRGVLDYVSDQQNPVGIGLPQVAVVGGAMLVVFSYSGPKGLPDNVDATPEAYPGVGYAFIPADGGNGAFELQVAKLTGFDYDPGCVRQFGVPFWGQYSGIDIHYPSQRVISAVEAGWSNSTDWVNSNAATWINIFS